MRYIKDSIVFDNNIVVIFDHSTHFNIPFFALVIKGYSFCSDTHAKSINFPKKNYEHIMLKLDWNSFFIIIIFFYYNFLLFFLNIAISWSNKYVYCGYKEWEKENPFMKCQRFDLYFWSFNARNRKNLHRKCFTNNKTRIRKQNRERWQM